MSFWSFKVTSWKSIALGALTAFLVVGAIGGSFYGGYLFGLRAPRVVSLDLQNITPPADLTEAPSGADFNIFWQAWRVIKDIALEGKNVSNQALVYGAINGLVGALEDPHSIFLPPEDSKAFEEDVRGSFSGVGMEIGKKNGEIVVVAPLRGTPAEKAGLLPDDKILKIDDTFTPDLEVEEAVKLIRGEEGTKVKLLIFRDNWDEPKEIEVLRAQINVPSVEFEIKSGNVGYIKLNSFSENAPQDFYEALEQAADGGAAGIIIDLRNNPGGFLEVAVDLAGWFLPEGTLVVSEEFRDGSKNESKSTGTGDLKDIPVVVLVNGGSASASEILAGALRDHGKAKLIGKTTFGKGTVQTLEKLSDGSTIKITIAHWVLPKGGIIEENGLEPDIEVEITEEDFEAERDPQLDRALEEIKKEIAEKE